MPLSTKQYTLFIFNNVFGFSINNAVLGILPGILGNAEQTNKQTQNNWRADTHTHLRSVRTVLWVNADDVWCCGTLYALCNCRGDSWSVSGFTHRNDSVKTSTPLRCSSSSHDIVYFMRQDERGKAVQHLTDVDAWLICRLRKSIRGFSFTNELSFINRLWLRFGSFGVLLIQIIFSPLHMPILQWCHTRIYIYICIYYGPPNPHDGLIILTDMATLHQQTGQAFHVARGKQNSQVHK